MCNKQKGKLNDDEIRKIIKLYQKNINTFAYHKDKYEYFIEEFSQQPDRKITPKSHLWNTFTLFLSVSNIILTHPKYKPKILCCISIGISHGFAFLLTIRRLPTLRNETVSVMYSCIDVCTQLLLSRYSILWSVNTHLY